MESSNKTSSKKPAAGAEDSTKFTPAQRKAVIAKVMKSTHTWPQKRALLNTLGIKPVRRRYQITFVVDIEEGLLTKKTIPQSTQRRLLSLIVNPGDPYGYNTNNIPADSNISLLEIKETGVVPPRAKKATATKTTRVAKKASVRKRTASR